MKIRPALLVSALVGSLVLLSGCGQGVTPAAPETTNSTTAPSSDPGPAGTPDQTGTPNPSGTPGGQASTPSGGSTDEPGSEHSDSEPDFYLLSMGKLGVIEIGEPIQTYVDQGYLEWDDSNEQCAYWKMQGPYDERGEIFEQAGGDGLVQVVGGTDPRFHTAEGISPGSTVGDVRAAYGDKLQYDYLRENGGAPIGVFFREGDLQIVFLIDRTYRGQGEVSSGDIPDVAKVQYMYTSVVQATELRNGPPASTC